MENRSAGVPATPDGRELDRRLAAVEGVVLDLDGCLILSTEPAGHDAVALPGAAELVAAARSSGRRVVAFTNASARTPEQISGSLRGLGVDLRPADILTPTVVAAGRIRERFADGHVLAFGGPGVVDVLAAAGIHVLTATQVQAGAQVAAVVVGWDPTFDQPKLQAAAEALWAGAALLVATDAPAFATAGRRTAGLVGFIAAGLARVGGCGYEVMGKPSAPAVAAAAAVLQTRPDALLVVGDDLTLEVAMARLAGGVGVLVTTGLHTRADASAAPAGLRPDLVVDRLDELAEALLRADRSASAAAGHEAGRP
jgi:HAD superfamily hydrolase (TIGR01450 family)